MIIANGFIRPVIKTGGGLDEQGCPVEAVESMGDPVACQWQKAAWDNLAREEQSHYVRKSYTILIDQKDRFDSEEFCLYGRDGFLGRYSVRSVEDLDAVCQTRITV